MEIIYNHAITRVVAYPKIADYSLNFSIVNDYKKVVGRKLLIFPIYSAPHDAIVKWWSGDYYCAVIDFKHHELFVENGILFRKPHYRIFLSDKSHKDVYFETVDELNKAIEEFKVIAPNLIFE